MAWVIFDLISGKLMLFNFYPPLVNLLIISLICLSLKLKFTDIPGNLFAYTFFTELISIDLSLEPAEY
jgi:hypothetical protein